jgi:four helix bundle protein
MLHGVLLSRFCFASNEHDSAKRRTPLLFDLGNVDWNDAGTAGREQGSVKDFRELKVWQKAHELTLAVYRVWATFPREELYGLTSQLRRSCSSIATNLAEGCGRNGDAEFARFCSIARGSASELEYHLLLARDLKLIKAADYDELAPRITELKRMLTGLLQKLNADR